MEIRDVIRALNKPAAHQDFPTVRNALKKLLILSNEEKDVKDGLSCVAKVLPLQDLIVKKLACILLIRFLDDTSDVSLLIQNTLRQDFNDPNPIVRSLALEVMCGCSSRFEGDVEKLLDVSMSEANAAYVRRAAILSCIAVHQRNPDLILHSALVDRLYEGIRDSDPLVVCNSLMALDEILASEGGVVINRNIAYHLLGQIPCLTEWGLVYVVMLLRKYKPKNQDELLDFLNVLDPLLQSANSAVVIETAKLFLTLLRDSPENFRESVYTRICPALASFLNNSTNPERVFLVLQFIYENIVDFAQFGVSAALTNSLYCKYSEPAHVKVKKIEILTKLPLTNSAAVLKTIDEIGMHCTDGALAVARAAVSALGHIASTHTGNDVFDVCVAKLLQLLSLEQDELVSESLFVLQNMDLRKLTDKRELMVKLQRCIRTVGSVEGKCAIVWLLGEYGEDLPESPYILEEFVSGNLAEIDSQIKHVILVTLLKMFFRRPAECQMILGRFMESCYEDIEMRDNVVFYYHLLKHDVELAKTLLFGA